MNCSNRHNKRFPRFLGSLNGYLLILLYLSSNIGLAQTSPERIQYRQIDGLSNNYILAFHQDRTGFMWIGTENGLNRFDGRHFISFRYDPDDSTSISNNWILDIHEDRAGNIWVGTQNGLNRLDREKGSFERVRLTELAQAGQKLSMSSLFEDRAGTIWAIAAGRQLMRVRYNEDEKAYTLESINGLRAEGQIVEAITDILQDPAGDYWLRLANGLARWRPGTSQVEAFPFQERIPFTRPDESHKRIVVSREGKIILLGNQGYLYQLSPSEDHPSIQPLIPQEAFAAAGISLTANRFFHLTLGEKNELWIASSTKVLRINLAAHTFGEENVKEFAFPFDVHSLLTDAQDMLWVGTAGGGIQILQKTSSPFSIFQHDPEDPQSLSPGIVRTFTETVDGTLWVGLLGNGIDQLERVTGQDWKKKGNLKFADSKRDNLIIEILQTDQQDLWIATNATGLKRFDLDTKTWTSYEHRPDDPNSISQDRIWGLAEDQLGNIWIGAFQGGLNRLDPRTNTVKRFVHNPADTSSLLNNQIKSLYTDTQGNIWIGSDAGLSRCDPQTESFQHFTHNSLNPSSLSGGAVWCIYEDHRGDLWIGTGLGLNRFDRQTETFEHFYEKDGLPSNTIYGLLQDQAQNLWVSTDDGLALLLDANPKNSFRTIHQKDGLAFTSFVPKAYYKSEQSGLLYFGSTQGIVSIDPAQLSKAQTPPKLSLHAFSRNNLQSKEGELLTDYFIEQKPKEISLTHQDQLVSFTFTDLSWKKNKAFTYDYKLIGLNQRWMPLNDELEVTFTNLDPGKYRLMLRAKDFYGQTQPEVQMLSLKVYPPWWRSKWAYISYVLSIALLLYSFYRAQLRRQLVKQEAASLRRLDRFKNRLYANITHEFRTPLTIIGGMAEQISKEPGRWLEKGTRMIRQNNTSLLNLVDQMLELQKVESGELKINYQLGDIIPFLQSIYEQFEGFAQSEQQVLTFHTDVNILEMDFDAEKITRIVSNLLSNAIKYTPEGGTVRFHIAKTENPEKLQLSITDTGMGIPADQLPHVFNRFFQASNNENASRLGTGIGLSLTKELVTLLQGEIEVNSAEGQGSTFSVWLPVSRKAVAQKPKQLDQVQTAVLGQHGPPAATNEPTDPTLPIALIVEDNPNIAEYIAICLGKNYQLRMASDGQQGIDMALEQIPDIIITDVMMPKKNGFELCQFLKEDERTSHIPIVMLTAKVDVDSRIVGLRQGADDYLAKPFHEEELLVRMQNLLHLRQKLQARYQNIYTQPLPVPAEETPTVHPEDAFILKLKAAFEAQMDNPDFDATALSAALYLSRSQLGRKVKALTGRSLSIYLRALRLQKAQQLLHSTELSIKEIAYEVGFPTSNYFSTSYQEEFGETPTNSREMGKMRK